jgi:alkylation response protein AidB-like acyl-CoA dehydrogenase
VDDARPAREHDLLPRAHRHGAKKQEGISFLLIDMKQPGVEVRPIITLDGEHEVNEVFFTDVRVPVENLVGEENKGWTCAKYLLTYERTNIAGVGFSVAALEQLKQSPPGRRRTASRLPKIRCSRRAWRASRSSSRT